MRVLTDKELLSLRNLLALRKRKHGISHLRVAIYARKSAEDDKQTSIPTQISLCEKFVNDYSDLLQVKYKFSEDDASGMQSYNRPEYLKMMSLAEQQLIDVIIVVKFDRLARDLVDIATAIKLLNLYGCQLVAGDDVSAANTPAGEFMRSILFAQNQYHARRVASDVMATECHNAKNGLTAGGTPPYGLKIVDKRFEINHNEAPAVKLMFEMVDKGHSYADIINDLERLGYTTRKKTAFTYTTINSMLRNDKYYGTYVYNRKGGKRKRDRVLIEEFDEVRNSKAIPPIISKQLFDSVQSILDGRKVVRPKSNCHSQFILTGLLFCKNCGRPMSGATNKGGSSGKSRRIYTCPNHHSKRGKTCITKALNAEYIEQAVKLTITESINKYLSRSLLSSVVFDKRLSAIKEEVGALSRRITELNSKISTFLEKASSPSVSKRVAERYEQQVDDCIDVQTKKQAEVNRLTAQATAITAIKDSCKQTPLLSVDDIFTSDKVSREVVRLFIKRIDVDDNNDDISIIFKS